MATCMAKLEELKEAKQQLTAQRVRATAAMAEKEAAAMARLEELREANLAKIYAKRAQRQAESETGGSADADETPDWLVRAADILEGDDAKTVAAAANAANEAKAMAESPEQDSPTAQRVRVTVAMAEKEAAAMATCMAKLEEKLKEAKQAGRAQLQAEKEAAKARIEELKEAKQQLKEQERLDAVEEQRVRATKQHASPGGKVSCRSLKHLNNRATEAKSEFSRVATEWTAEVGIESLVVIALQDDDAQAEKLVIATLRSHAADAKTLFKLAEHDFEDADAAICNAAIADLKAVMAQVASGMSLAGSAVSKHRERRLTQALAAAGSWLPFGSTLGVVAASRLAAQAPIACWGCGLEPPTGAHFKRCPTCADLKLAPAHFCSEECQAEHWPRHKQLHKLTTKAPAKPQPQQANASADASRAAAVRRLVAETAAGAVGAVLAAARARDSAEARRVRQEREAEAERAERKRREREVRAERERRAEEAVRAAQLADARAEQEAVEREAERQQRREAERVAREGRERERDAHKRAWAEQKAAARREREAREAAERQRRERTRSAPKPAPQRAPRPPVALADAAGWAPRRSATMGDDDGRSVVSVATTAMPLPRPTQHAVERAGERELDRHEVQWTMKHGEVEHTGFGADGTPTLVHRGRVGGVDVVTDADARAVITAWPARRGRRLRAVAEAAGPSEGATAAKGPLRPSLLLGAISTLRIDAPEFVPPARYPTARYPRSSHGDRQMIVAKHAESTRHLLEQSRNEATQTAPAPLASPCSMPAGARTTPLWWNASTAVRGHSKPPSSPPPVMHKTPRGPERQPVVAQSPIAAAYMAPHPAAPAVLPLQPPHQQPACLPSARPTPPTMAPQQPLERAGGAPGDVLVPEWSES